MTYSHEVETMCPVKQGVAHGAAPIPEEAKWVKAKEIKDISGFTHGIGWCAPQQGTCKLSLNVKDGVIQEALVETIGCSGMTHSAAMAAEILPGRTGRRTEIHPCHRSTVHHDEIHADRRHNPQNVREYLAYDRIAACGGSWMVKNTMIENNEFDRIEELVKEAVEIVKESRT